MAKNQTHQDDDSLGLNATRVIEIAGKRFAAGLLWWPIKHGASPKKEIVRFGSEQGMNMAAISIGAMGSMAGFAQATSAQTKLFSGAWALAPVLADKLGESWIGLFELEDGNNILIAVHDGSIVPGCDMVGEPEEVRAQFSEMSHVYDWARVYVNDSRLAALFEPEKVKAIDLKNVLTDKGWDKSYKLRPIKKGVDQRLVLAGIVGVLLVAGGGGWRWYSAQQEAQIQARNVALAQARRAAKNQEQRQQALEQVDAMAPVPGWYGQPLAADVLLACDKGVKSLPISVAAWSLEAVRCDGKTVVATYARFLGTTINDFYAQANDFKEQGRIRSFYAGPDKGTLTVQLPALEARGFEAVLEDGEWTRAWISNFQVLTLDSTLKNKPHPPPPAPDKSLVELVGIEKATPPAPWWITHTWEFSAPSITPQKILAPIPKAGLVIKSVELAINQERGSWIWTTKGEVNVK